MPTAPTNIDEYIARFPEHVQEILEEIRSIVSKAAPDAVEAIKYQIPTFVLGQNLVHFAAYDNHIGFYPTPSGMTHFKEELSKYPTGKGSVQFPFNKKMPYPLIKKVVKFRVQEVRDKLANKSKK